MKQLSKGFEQSQRFQARNTTFQHIFLIFTRDEILPGVELKAFGEIGLLLFCFVLFLVLLLTMLFWEGVLQNKIKGK